MVLTAERKFIFTDNAWHLIPLVGQSMIVGTLKNSSESLAIGLAGKVFHSVTNLNTEGFLLGDTSSPIFVDYDVYVKCDYAHQSTPYTVLVRDLGV